MTIFDLTPEKKYYQFRIIADYGTMRREASIIRVIKIDISGRRALASVNCCPAQWYHENIFKHWLDENPLLIKTANPLS